MIIIDNALSKLEDEDKPIRIGIIGAGFIARAIAMHITCSVPAVNVVAICNRHIDKAKDLCAFACISDASYTDNPSAFENGIDSKRCMYTDDYMLIANSEQIDAVIEATGTVAYGSEVVLSAIKGGKHVILMNAELDATLGPILKNYADRYDVTYTNSDGDQPGSTMNLLRSVKGMGFKPVLCGNIKGLLDNYRTPQTQQTFARKWGQNPKMTASFADGSKISFEQAVTANAAGMSVGKRGMHGPSFPERTPINEAAKWFEQNRLLKDGGIVDYVIGASPAPGVFVLAGNENVKEHMYLDLFKMGKGPIYCFYTPYHLCHMEIHNTIARAVLFKDAAAAPISRPYVGVISTAKKDIKIGQVLDGIGGFTAYGQCENSKTISKENLLMHGLSEGCILKKDIAKDTVILASDIERPKGRLCDKLEEEQNELFQ